jgi:hypothetical protein
VKSVLRIAPLVALGLVLVLAGGLADVAFHAAPPALGQELAPLLGADGVRAHLLTLIGMLVACAGLIQRGLHQHLKE